MAKRKRAIPQYGTVTLNGIDYYRTRVQNADGKQVSLYATTCEELYEKQLEARKQVEEIIFHRKHPTVAEYCEKWLLMQSAKVSTATIKGYRQNMKNYVINSLGDMYMEEVTADDIRLALVPLSQKSKGLYDTVNMLIKCVFYSAERSQLITDNPCVGISAKGGKASKKKDALTDQQVAILLDTVKELPPYLFIMIGLYSGLRREEILALQWDSVFLDESTPYISVRRAWRAEHNRRVCQVFCVSYNRPVISTVLKTKAAKRDIPIPRDYNLVSCGVFDEMLAAAALKHRDKLLERSRKIVRENLQILDDWVGSEPHVSYVKPKAGTTALVYYDLDISSYEFCEEMYKKTGAFVTPGDCFEVPHSMRIGYAYGKQDLIDGLKAISEYIAMKTR